MKNMDSNTVVTLQGKDYLLTQKVFYNGHNYFMAGEIEGSKMLNTYGVLKESVVNGQTILSSVEDEKELAQVYAMLTSDLLDETEKLEKRIPAGAYVDVDGREYIVMDYIPYDGRQYMVLMTSGKPVDVMVSMLDVMPNGDVSYSDVSTLPVAKEVLKAFSIIHANDEE